MTPRNREVSLLKVASFSKCWKVEDSTSLKPAFYSSLIIYIRINTPNENENSVPVRENHCFFSISSLPPSEVSRASQVNHRFSSKCLCPEYVAVLPDRIRFPTPFEGLTLFDSPHNRPSNAEDRYKN
jgi:hypothetical protein